MKITFQNNAPSIWKKLRYVVVEGSGTVRTVVSAHRSIAAAEKAAARWLAPASVAVIDRTTGEEK